MSKITIRYNYNTDETTVHLSEEFEALPLIHQCDALRDAFYELEQVYDAKLKRCFPVKPQLAVT